MEDNADLKRLIDKLSISIKNKEKYLEKVKHPDLLVNSLKDLNNMIGMSRAKKSIAHQVVKLVKNLNCKNPSQSNMLHTVLYGPPGVGKTQVGIILAKIWYSIGYIKGSTTNNYEADFNMYSSPDINPFLIIFIYVLIFLALSLPTNYSIYAWILLIVLIIVCYFYYNYKPKKSEKISSSSNSSENINDRDIITVVSRKDFVAGYVGQSAIKTSKLLDDNKGKVLFIDEAYSLINDDRDPFGNEVLTTLNLYMSEHPDEIGIIFAGYKDKLENGIFNAQPGLPRRCMWHFDCDPYNGKELSAIFFKQLQKQNCNISDDDKNKITNLIINNTDLFPSYGGDTERLAYFSQLGTTTDDIDKIDVIDENTENLPTQISYNNVFNGLQRLKENHGIQNNKKTCDDQYFSKLFSNLSSNMSHDSEKSTKNDHKISIIDDIDESYNTDLIKKELNSFNNNRQIDMIH